eukprot:926983-Pyramimonas_sp.AAC.1
MPLAPWGPCDLLLVSARVSGMNIWKPCCPGRRFVVGGLLIARFSAMWVGVNTTCPVGLTGKGRSRRNRLVKFSVLERLTSKSLRKRVNMLRTEVALDEKSAEARRVGLMGKQDEPHVGVPEID